MLEKLIAHSVDIDPCCLVESEHLGYFMATVETCWELLFI